MQAWIATPSLALLGHSPVGLRGFFILTASLSIWLTFLAGRRLYDERTGVLAAFLVGLVPMLFTGMIEGKPDAPLLFFWAATIWALSHALSGDSPRWWIAAGLFLGLAMDSKHHAVFSRSGSRRSSPSAPISARGSGARSRGWASRVSLVAFSPTVIWNARHEWQSFVYQGVTRPWARARPAISRSRSFRCASSC